MKEEFEPIIDLEIITRKDGNVWLKIIYEATRDKTEPINPFYIPFSQINLIDIRNSCILIHIIANEYPVEITDNRYDTKMIFEYGDTEEKINKMERENELVKEQFDKFKNNLMKFLEEKE